MSVDFEACDRCGDVKLDELITDTGDGQSLCNKCFNGDVCNSCGESFEYDYLIECDDMESVNEDYSSEYTCINCIDGHIEVCHSCALEEIERLKDDKDILKHKLKHANNIVIDKVIDILNKSR